MGKNEINTSFFWIIGTYPILKKVLLSLRNARQNMKKSVIIANLQSDAFAVCSIEFFVVYNLCYVPYISKNVLLSQIEQQLLSSVANSPNYDIKCHAGEAEHSIKYVTFLTSLIVVMWK